MLFGLVALLLIATTGATTNPICGRDAETPLRQALVAELNAARLRASLEPLEAHPVLCDIARNQAKAVAATGGTPTNVGHINSTTRRLYRAGYKPHAWTEGSLIATSDIAILSQWRGARPEWYKEMEGGDFEHIGIGLARHRGRLVVTLVLALETRTVEWRQAAPLANLAGVRQIALATVNDLRRKHDREPVVAENRLDAAAQRHAEDMLRREFYDHTSPEGNTIRDRSRAAGYRGARALGENIAKGLFAPDEVVHRWMDSSGHRRNILKRGFREVGLGVAFGVNRADEFEVVWVQVFATP